MARWLLSMVCYSLVNPLSIGSMSIGKTLLSVLLMFLVGCSSIYFGALEKLGYAKRDLLVSRVEAARESQEEAKEQFKSALERFRSVVRFSGGKLEQQYETLRAELNRCEDRAKNVRSRIDAVEDVSGALFTEWKSELAQYSNAFLRRQSEDKLERTKRRYTELMRTMKEAEKRLEPVLQPLRDNVLFLKHNLNARAIAALDGEVKEVEIHVDSLVSDLERAIAASDRFIAEMNEDS
jgi:chaperonin cofactor prefoldin